MSATSLPLERRRPRDGRGIRRAIGCLAAALTGGGVAWSWATPLASLLQVSWLAPATGLLAGVAIAIALGTVDADERST